MLTTLTPIITKRLLTFLEDSYAWHHATAATQAALALPPGIGRGLGLAFGLYIMTQASSLFNNHNMQKSLSTGMLIRSVVTAAVSRKSLRLSGAARVKHPNGQLTNFISSDASFLEWSVLLVNHLWIEVSRARPSCAPPSPPR